MTALEVLKLVLDATAKDKTHIVINPIELEVVQRLESIGLFIGKAKDGKIHVMW